MGDPDDAGGTDDDRDASDEAGDPDGPDDADDPPSLADRRDAETTVYPPSEDSGLLAEAATAHVEPDDLVLEVGVGSGWVAERVAAGAGARVVGSDVNPHACRRARERGVETVRADLVAPFRDGAFDAVLFNPPYLPTDPDAAWDDWMEAALSGGESGRAVVAPFVDEVGRLLAPGGRVLLLVSTLSGVDAVAARAERRGFDVRTVREASYPFETLSVLLLS